MLVPYSPAAILAAGAGRGKGLGRWIGPARPRVFHVAEAVTPRGVPGLTRRSP